MLTKNELISGAMDMASYLVSKTDGIDKIILHGSIARGDFDEESDIDLFIDTNLSQKKIQKIAESYYKTEKYKNWKLKGLDKEFSLIIGRLDSGEWKNLKRAMLNTGIILYGKYKAQAEKVNHYTLFSFENIKPHSKRISVFRKLFGFTQNKKNYPGMIEKINAVKIGKGAVLVPIEHAQKISSYLKEKKVTPRVYDFWTDEKV
ncbi:MAG: nucleotidyltransferase domain-containing protein [Nanoarchaeota archaeon]|nr:nucleotidyltransferase domain-containing protein [Nanoarchaeota archaeon]